MAGPVPQTRLDFDELDSFEGHWKVFWGCSPTEFVCFLHDCTELIGIWEEYHGSKVPFISHPIEAKFYQYD